MKSINKNYQFPFLFLLLAACPALGGELTLTNGDIIHGDLVAEDEHSLTWKSDVFGEISVPRENVQQMLSGSVVQGEPVQAEPIKEAAPTPERSLVKGSAELAYKRKQGNTDSENVDAEIVNEWELGLYRHEVKLQVEYEEKNGSRIEERYESDYQLNYDYDEHWFSYGRVEYEKDRFGSYYEQHQIGTGLGYQTTLDNYLKINAQGGVSYFVTKDRDGKKRTDPAGRWALDLNWPFPKTEVSLFHRHELLWLLTDASYYQLESSTGMKIPLVGGIYSELRYDYDYVSEVDDDERRGDHEWRALLGYEW